MRKITRVEMGKYGCNDCRFYTDKWTCSLEECILVSEAQQKTAAPPVRRPVARWEVIR